MILGASRRRTTIWPVRKRLVLRRELCPPQSLSLLRVLDGIGHYSPQGNHFFAYSIKDKVVEWLDPKLSPTSSPTHKSSILKVTYREGVTIEAIRAVKKTASYSGGSNVEQLCPSIRSYWRTLSIQRRDSAARYEVSPPSRSKLSPSAAQRLAWSKL